jgi:hypothetical protein
MDVDFTDSVSSTTTPSKKKHNPDTPYKARSDLSSEKPSSKREITKSSSFSNSEPKHRPQGTTPSKSTTPSKLTSKEVAESSDSDSDEFIEENRGDYESRPITATTSNAMDVSDDEDDAPVAKSFKSAKKEAIDLHHEEQEDVRKALAKEKERRRQRTQLLQEQSKLSTKKKNAEKRRKAAEMEAAAASEEDTDEEIELLPESILKQALSQNKTAAVIEKDVDERARRVEQAKKKQEEAKLQQDLKINSKLVTVVPLTDSTGTVQMQSRKVAAKSAESFLKDHLWGGRLERMRSDLYLSERTRGPALQFIVPNGSTSIVSTTSSASMKSKRHNAAQQKKRLKK